MVQRIPDFTNHELCRLAGRLSTPGRPVGLIDVTDVVDMLPEIEEHASERAAKPEDRGFRERRAA
jgi:hypothetical protein